MEIPPEGLYGPNSMVRRISRETVLYALGGSCALLMQLAHPLVAAAVDRHSDFQRKPMKRLSRTVELSLLMVFGTGQEALEAARAINRAHLPVRGKVEAGEEPFPMGTPYAALDPDLLFWVHATLIYSAVVTYGTFVEPLNVGEKYAFLSEMKRSGALLGIPDSAYPRDWSGFEDYLGRMLGGPVRVGPTARRLADAILKPPVAGLPRQVLLPVEFPLRVITAGLLPESLRSGYRLSWNSAARFAFGAACKVVPVVVARSPDLVRVVPIARRAARREIVAA
jgi:uncharacterized protein (DUF2236 family)